jgi:hypothetical protein
MNSSPQNKSERKIVSVQSNIKQSIPNLPAIKGKNSLKQSTKTTSKEEETPNTISSLIKKEFNVLKKSFGKPETTTSAYQNIITLKREQYNADIND